MNPTRKDIKNKLWEYEYYSSGLSGLNGTGANIENLVISKKANKISYDIEFYNDDEGTTERYDDCSVPYDKFIASYLN